MSSKTGWRTSFEKCSYTEIRTASKYKIHAFYILLILVSVIVVLITVEWAKIDDLVSYLTFALTVSSLGLAVLAIVYSFFSNTTFAQNISTLESTTKSLNSTSTKLSESTDELGKKLDTVPSVIKTVGDKVDKTHELVTEMQSQKNRPAVSVAEGGDNSESKTKDTEVERFLNLSSFNGLLSVYIFCLSYKTGKPFNLEEITNDLGMDDNYAHGYAVATASAGLINFASKDGFMVAKSVNAEVLEKISNGIEKKINELGEDSMADPYFRDELLEDKSKVETYFSEM